MYGPRRSRKRRRGKRRRGLSFATRARRAVMRVAETKRHILNTGNESSLSLISGFNTYRLFNLSQGDSSYTRDGDKIYITNVQGKLIFTHEGGYPAYIRVVILAAVRDAVDTSLALFEGINDTDMTMLNARAAGWHVPITAKFNKEAVRIHYSKTFRMEPLTQRTKMIQINKKVMKSVKYDGSANTAPESRMDDWYIVVMGADASNDESTPSVEISGQVHVYFKDF